MGAGGWGVEELEGGRAGEGNGWGVGWLGVGRAGRGGGRWGYMAEELMGWGVGEVEGRIALGSDDLGVVGLGIVGWSLGESSHGEGVALLRQKVPGQLGSSCEGLPVSEAISRVSAGCFRTKACISLVGLCERMPSKSFFGVRY